MASVAVPLLSHLYLISDQFTLLLYITGGCEDNAIGGSFSELTSSLHVKQKFGEQDENNVTIPVTGAHTCRQKLDVLTFTP